MRKIIFLTTFFFSFTINAQYFMYGYNIVPEDEIEHYLQNERELYGKAAEKAFKDGVINGWAIMRRIQGGKSEPNFSYNSIPMMAAPFCAISDLRSRPLQ